MSYQVLARKWRPRFFREMVGQEHVLQALINALDHDRLHHAYLFTGTRGVGKTTIARILAKCLNCETGVSSEPCGQCSACQEISNSCFVDLIEVDAASNTGVDDVREIIDNAQYRPSKGRYKVYLIDEVHMLSKSAFNALLKTLEEPPEHVKFLLATTDPQKLPATILSRCLQFNLKNMAPERIVQHLSNVLGQEMVEFEEAGLWALARSAEGSMRDALSLTDQAIAFGSGKVLEQEVRVMLGSIDQQTVYHLAEGLFAHNAKALLDTVAAFSEQSPNYEAALDELLTLLHRVTVAQMVPDAIDNSLGDKDRVLALAQSVTGEELQLFYQMGLLGKKDIALAPDLRTGLEMSLLRMLAFRPEGLREPPVKDLPLVSQATAQEETAKKPEGRVVQHSPEKEPVLAAPVAQPETEALPSEPRAAVPEQTQPEPFEKQPESVSALLQDAENLLDSLDTPEPEVATVDTTVASSEPVVEQVTTNQSAAAITDNPSWLENFKKLEFSGLVKAIAAECILCSVANDQWQFYLDKTRAQLFNPQHASQIADHLSKQLGKTIEVDVQLERPESLGQGQLPQTPTEYIEMKKAQAHEKALAFLQDDKNFSYFKEQFGAKLVSDSVVPLFEE